MVPDTSSRHSAVRAIMARAESFTDEGDCPSAQLIVVSAVALLAAVFDQDQNGMSYSVAFDVLTHHRSRATHAIGPARRGFIEPVRPSCFLCHGLVALPSATSANGVPAGHGTHHIPRRTPPICDPRSHRCPPRTGRKNRRATGTAYAADGRYGAQLFFLVSALPSRPRGPWSRISGTLDRRIGRVTVGIRGADSARYDQLNPLAL